MVVVQLFKRGSDIAWIYSFGIGNIKIDVRRPNQGMKIFKN